MLFYGLPFTVTSTDALPIAVLHVYIPESEALRRRKDSVLMLPNVEILPGAIVPFIGSSHVILNG
jgi:hypothetical protein